MRDRSIRVRFSLWTGLLLFLGFLIFGSFFYLRLSAELTNSFDETLRITAAQILADVEQDLIDEGLLDLQGIVDFNPSDVILGKLIIKIFDLEGSLAQHFGVDADYSFPDQSWLNSREIEHFITITHRENNIQYRILTRKILINDDMYGFLQVGQDFTETHQTLFSLLVFLLLSGPVIIVIAMIGGYLLAMRALRPIDRITTLAQQFSTSDLTQRLKEPEINDELGRLIHTLNSMLNRLEDGFKRERQFTSDASHEFRTPLSNIQLILDTALLKPRSNGNYVQFLTDVQEEVDRMKHLINELLALARNDAIQFTNIHSCNVLEILNDLSEIFKASVEEKDLFLSFDCSAEIQIDSTKSLLSQLLINILENAMKYTDRGGINVEVRDDDLEYVSISVRDTGRGIASNHIPHIFDRFYRVDQSRSTEGSGLGLAIAQRIAVLHGGAIEVISEVGKGSTFTIRLKKNHHELN
jgi:two-component system OmpR family sensor kinase